MLQIPNRSDLFFALLISASGPNVPTAPNTSLISLLNWMVIEMVFLYFIPITYFSTWNVNYQKYFLETASFFTRVTISWFFTRVTITLILSYVCEHICIYVCEWMYLLVHMICMNRHHSEECVLPIISCKCVSLWLMHECAYVFMQKYIWMYFLLFLFWGFFIFVFVFSFCLGHVWVYAFAHDSWTLFALEVREFPFYRTPAVPPYCILPMSE